jgi:diguanylate cyclase (GGDEF)-like protein/PAS domain S-box-containing protein
LPLGTSGPLLAALAASLAALAGWGVGRRLGGAGKLRALEGHKQVLELIASGKPLEPVLQAITRWMEDAFPGMLCTILLLDETGTRLRCAAVSSMPAEYNAAIDNIAIGPGVGSCGTAAYLREPVVASDIATDPRWERYRHLALPHGLRACWSMPIKASTGAVLGTLAMYYREAREPSARELEAIRVSSSLAGIAIERIRGEERMRAAEERFELVAKATNELVWDWNLVNNQIWWNDAYHALFGYSEEETSPGIDSWKDFLHPKDRGRVLSEVQAVIAGGGQSWSGEYRFRRKDGSYATLFDRGFVVRDEAGRAVRMIGAAMDITERKRVEEKLEVLAQFDALTGLPNRVLFRDRLAQAITRAHREEWRAALLFVDLDGFKEINDTLGHAAGDEVLREVALRLRACLREGDTVARLGGDEFTVILEDAGSPAHVEKLVRKLLDVFAQPLRVSPTGASSPHEFYASASVGVALYPDDAQDPASLLRFADTAMYHAKAEGLNAYRRYLPDMTSRAAERITLESRLRQALERDEFELHYQPIVRIASGELACLEALLRWRHPERGVLPPAQFIGVAEQSGLIVPIGEWALREACAQAARWHAAGLERRVSVNLSARQLRKRDLPQRVAECLRASSLPGDWLTLEITESLLMENAEGSRRLLSELKAMGVRVALDDFGTGYSSLAYLRQFPLDSVKIDRLFVQGLADKPEDAAIIRAMIGLAHNLQLTLTAEGVETPGQLRFLREAGCDHAQGFLFSVPLPADEVPARIRDRYEIPDGGS